MNNNNSNNINMGDIRGHMDLDNYIISRDLHTSLQQGALVNNNQDLDKFYMVMIKVFNRDSRSLVYNYISYSTLFYDTFAYYFNTRSLLIGNVYKEPSSLLTIHDANSLDYTPDDKLYICKNFLPLQGLDLSTETYKYDTSNVGIFRFINKLSLVVTIDYMSFLVNLAMDKNYISFTKEVLGSIKGHEQFIKNVSNTQSINIIDSCLFVVGNLDKFVTCIKNYGYNINTGSQKHRGHVNSIQNSLCMLDAEYRKSLYTHHRYHITKGNIDTSFGLNKDKFSFKNIHSNLGGVKWYSTKSKKTINLVNQISASDHNSIYDQLAEYFNNLPINEDTQKEVEELLSKYSEWLFTKKEEGKLKRESSTSLYIDYDLISKDFSKILKDKKAIISDYIDNVRKRHYNNKPKKKNELSLYYLHNILKTVKTSYVLSIVYGRVLRIINVNEKIFNLESSICLELGGELVKNYHFCLYENYKLSYEKDNKNFYMSDWKKINNKIIKEYDDKDANFTCSLGAILVKWLLDVNLIEEKWIRKGRKESINILVPTEDLLNSLNNKDNTYYLPHKLPMVVRPKPYYRIKLSNGHIKEHLGGYLLNDVAYTDEIIKQKWNNKKDTEIRDENVIYDLVNNINCVGFKVNTDVLNFINTYRYIYDLIDTDKDNFNNLLAKPKLNESEYIKLESYLSKKVQDKNILGIAKAYSNLHEFFLPVRLDFRGRLNCISEYLNYQSSELAKALLLFSKPEKIYKTDISAIYFLKSYGANCFGNKLDKKSWNERAKWVDDNIDDIINFKNGKLIKQSENKLMFIAFCFEYNRLLDSFDNVNTTYFETYLPIRLDATCNGYQHIALLSLDTNLARELNLTKSSKSDTPKDYYSFIGINLVSLYKRKLTLPNLSELDRECYTRLSILDVIRELLKRAVMVKPYNATPFKIVESIKEAFQPVNVGQDTPLYWEKLYVYKKNDNIKLKERDFVLIRDGIEEILSDNVFKIKKLMTYLERIAKILAELSLIIPWASPQGVNIYQSYIATEEIRLKPFTYSKKTFSLTVPNKEGKLNKTKQVRAFMPNLIHSLDAASLALLVDFYFNNSKNIGVKNIFTVHDCFGVTANNVENIMDLLKLVYTRIYSDTNYLRKLDKGIIDYIKLSYKDSCFDDEKLELHMDDKIIKYPSIEAVLGTSSKGSDLIFDSSYIIH